VRLDGLLIALLLTACSGAPDPALVDVRTESAAPRLKAKGGDVWRNDLSQGLRLESNELCLELSRYDCVEDVHLIAMGGMEPERLGIDEPLPFASNSPIAYDRVAISACAARYDADVAGSPAMFNEAVDGDLSSEDRAAISHRLIEGLLSRRATDEQVEGLVSLYDTLQPLSSDLVADWSIGACVVVATSTEALFY